MSDLRRFFGHEQSARDSQLRAEAARAAEGLDVEAELAAHRLWKEQLLTQLTGRPGRPPSEQYVRLDRDLVCRDDICPLGQWIHGRGRARLGAFPGFSDLLAHHRMFHHVAGNILTLDAAGKKVDALRMLDEQLEDYSARVTADLRLLQQIATDLRPGSRSS